MPCQSLGVCVPFVRGIHELHQLLCRPSTTLPPSGYQPERKQLSLPSTSARGRIRAGTHRTLCGREEPALREEPVGDVTESRGRGRGPAGGQGQMPSWKGERLAETARRRFCAAVGGDAHSMAPLEALRRAACSRLGGSRLRRGPGSPPGPSRRTTPPRLRRHVRACGGHAGAAARPAVLPGAVPPPEPGRRGPGAAGGRAAPLRSAAVPSGLSRGAAAPRGPDDPLGSRMRCFGRHLHSPALSFRVLYIV